jgi:hypothetical protein
MLLFKTLGRPIVAALFFAAPLSAYHLELEARPAAVFPYLTKFGTVDIDVYPSGVRAETIWLNGFSRNGAQTITVENPLGRMYTEVPIKEIAALLNKLGSAAGSVESGAVPATIKKLKGKVSGIAATRHRLEYGPTAYVDYWTTDAVPENPQLRRIVSELLTAISPGTAQAASSIRGTPVYVEVNFRRFKKVVLLRTKKLDMSNGDEQAALKVGSFYFKAPLLDALWK